MFGSLKYFSYMRERERERVSLYTPRLECDTHLPRVAKDLGRGFLFAPYFALYASLLSSIFSTSSRPFAISTDETPSSNKNLFIDSLRSRGNSSWMYVGNHHASTFFALGHHSLCNVISIYNRSIALHCSSPLIDKLSSEVVSGANSAMLMRCQCRWRVWSSEILYKLVYDKQGGLRRSYRTETGSYDLSPLLLCNI